MPVLPKDEIVKNTPELQDLKTYTLVDDVKIFDGKGEVKDMKQVNFYENLKKFNLVSSLAQSVVLYLALST